MNLQPLYDRIVVKRIEDEFIENSFLIAAPNTKEKPTKAEVIAVGHGKRLTDGSLRPLDVKVGDVVFFGKYAGVEIKYANDEYLILKEHDVISVLN